MVHGLAILRGAPTRRAPQDDATSSKLQLHAPAKRVAGLHRALSITGHEPLLALRGGAVGEGVRHHPAVACRCSVSSPIALAVVSAASISPASRKPGRFFSSRLTQTPDRQSACNSTLTCKALAPALSPTARSCCCCSVTFGRMPSR